MGFEPNLLKPSGFAWFGLQWAAMGWNELQLPAIAWNRLESPGNACNCLVGAENSCFHLVRAGFVWFDEKYLIFINLVPQNKHTIIYNLIRDVC